MHVDGFRFDLVTVLGREPEAYDTGAAFFDIVHQDPVLSRVKLIGEPWDIGDFGYQVGNLPVLWSEWNGKYRDNVRRFWKGDPGQIAELAYRLSGSSDLYRLSGRGPTGSINFLTAHDGFTLRDLVTYNDKHNEANGEGGRDGTNENYSWNSGVEGRTDDPGVLDLRRRRAKNFLATLLLSQGVPMLLAGDEFLRTQRGNNNAYCQDNEVSWVDWTLAGENAEFLRFTREMIALRRRHPALRRRGFFHGAEPLEAAADVIWHGAEAGWPDFSTTSRVLAYALDGRRTGREPDRDFYVAFNGWEEAMPFEVPPSPSDRPWRRVIDTALPSPKDIVGLEQGPRVAFGALYPVEGFSLVVFISEA